MKEYILFGKEYLRQYDIDNIELVLSTIKEFGQVLEIPDNFKHHQEDSGIIIFLKFHFLILRITYRRNRFEICGMRAENLNEFSEKFYTGNNPISNSFYFRKFNHWLNLDGLRAFFEKLENIT